MLSIAKRVTTENIKAKHCDPQYLKWRHSSLNCKETIYLIELNSPYFVCFERYFQKCIITCF